MRLFFSFLLISFSYNFCIAGLNIEMDSVKEDFIYKGYLDDVFTVAEEKPLFPGGEQEMVKYLKANIKYPDEARAKNITGTVLVKFIVCKDGYLRNVKAIAQLAGGCSEEAERLVTDMNYLPKRWKPGKFKGHIIDSYWTVQMKFKP